MGFSQSWLAVKGKSRREVLDALGLRGTGTREETPDSPVVGAELATGWYLVVAGRSGHRLTRQENLHRLSAGCDVVSGDVEEHVMVSAAAGWKNGQKVWSVIHDSQRGREDLQTEGELPAAFARIRDRLCAKHCLFDIPVELARSLTGYRHDDDDPDAGAPLFEVLVETSPNAAGSAGKPSFLKRLFGR